MFRKSYHEALYSQQDPNDPYSRYREHRKKMLMNVSPEKKKDQQHKLDKMAVSAVDKALKKFFPLVK